MHSLWVLYDQLWSGNAILAHGQPGSDVVVMIESDTFLRALPHHRVKLAFFLSAMRHFAEELREAGWKVDYYPYQEAGTYAEALSRHLERWQPEKFRVLAPNDYALHVALPKLARKLGVPIEPVPTNQFLVDREAFAEWAGEAKSLRMERHYRRMRQATGYLMTADGEPEGGSWNFDQENREGIKAWTQAGRPLPPPTKRPTPDGLTREVIAAVDRDFPSHAGEATALWLPVTRRESLDWLRRFVRERLSGFGPYEDLMVVGEGVLYHSVLSPMLNIGLLTPTECIEVALEFYNKEEGVPLSSVEGFIRQILGWREFINGIYWLRMPGYRAVNALGADRRLPEWLWEFDSPMRCFREVLGQLKATGFNHHIQRLMVLGNYFLLTGSDPQAVLEWYTAQYVDAHDWVMAANVLGMVLHADGGFMASKPYAAGSGYISRMSDYCAGCQYKPSVKTGPQACPFNYLYWSFFDRHQERFVRNPRVAAMIRGWQKRSAVDQEAVRKSAREWLDAHHPVASVSPSLPTSGRHRK